MVDSVDTYRGLAAETGVDPGWREVGSLRLASSPERMEELRRQAGWAKAYGLAMELIGPIRGAGPIPPDVDRWRAGRRLAADRWLPRPDRPDHGPGGGCPQGRRPDRRADPGDGHRRGGRSGAGRRDRPGPMRREMVVNAAGMFAPEIGRMAGVTVPVIPFAHQYLVTEAVDGVEPDLPQLRDPDNLVYFRPEVRGPGDGRLRAQPGARSGWTAFRPTSTASCCRPTGRGSRRSAPARCGACRPWPMPACGS